MPLANRAGRFRAQVLDQGFSETGPNKLVTFIPRFRLIEEAADDEWRDVSEEAMEITAYVYLERRDHAVNDVALKQLIEAFGWDGRDAFWLEDQRPLIDCQVTLDFEEYQGRRRLKVQWINAFDSEPTGIQHSTEDQRKQIRARLGSKLRSMAGGAPAAKPAARPQTATPATAPPAPARAPAPPTAPQPQPDGEARPSTMNEAWDVFYSKAQKLKLQEKQIGDCWYRAIERVSGGQDATKVTPEQWAAIAMKGPELPF